MPESSLSNKPQQSDLIHSSALSLEGDGKDAPVSSSDEESDGVSGPCNEEHKAGHRAEQHRPYVDIFYILNIVNRQNPTV